MAATLSIDSPEAMFALGERLGRLVHLGDVIGLVGELGAGKTLFVQGLASGLGVAPEQVTSPTFTLIHIHDEGRVPLYHVDLYRLNNETELYDAGIDDLYRQDGVVAVEWFDRFPVAAPAARLEIALHVVSDHERRVELTPFGAHAEELARRLAA